MAIIFYVHIWFIRIIQFILFCDFNPVLSSLIFTRSFILLFSLSWRSHLLILILIIEFYLTFNLWWLLNWTLCPIPLMGLTLRLSDYIPFIQLSIILLLLLLSVHSFVDMFLFILSVLRCFYIVDSYRVLPVFLVRNLSP